MTSVPHSCCFFLVFSLTPVGLEPTASKTAQPRPTNDAVDRAHPTTLTRLFPLRTQLSNIFAYFQRALYFLSLCAFMKIHPNKLNSDLNLITCKNVIDVHFSHFAKLNLFLVIRMKFLLKLTVWKKSINLRCDTRCRLNKDKSARFRNIFVWRLK